MVMHAFTLPVRVRCHRWALAVVLWCAIFCPGSNCPVGAEEPAQPCDLVKPATETAGSAYGALTVDASTETSLRAALGKPISAKAGLGVWIGTEGCRQMGLKMVRGRFTADGVLSQASLDLRQPLPRAVLVDSLGLGKPTQVRSDSNLTLEVYLPANLALGVHNDQVIRLYLFGRHTPGMPTNAGAPSGPDEETVEVPIPETQDEKDDALRQAVQLADAAYVGQLLAAGASPLSADPRGWTALHEAAYAGCTELVPVLVVRSIGSDPAKANEGFQTGKPFAALLDKADTTGATALHLACAHGRSDVAKALLRMGADPNVADKEKRTPLHLAALAGNLELVESLLLAQADVHRRTGRGYTPLDLASDEAIRRLLTQAAARAGVDPAQDQAKEVVEVFLKAACEGDSAKMKACVIAALRDKLPPGAADRGKFQWEVASVGFEPGVAVVHCTLSPPDGAAEPRSVSGVFRLRCREDIWQIADLELPAGPAGSP